MEDLLHDSNTDTERYRTARKRIWAAIIDFIVFMPFLLVNRYLLKPDMNRSLLSGWLLFTIFAPIAYRIVLHFKYGQTIGKWAADIKVLDISESRPVSLLQSFLRDIFYTAIQLCGLFYYFVLVMRDGDAASFIADFNNFTSLPLFLWFVAEIVVMFANDKRRTIHDFIASTIVVRIKK